MTRSGRPSQSSRWRFKHYTRRRDDAATNGQHLITDPERSARPLHGGASACHEMHNEKNEADDEQDVK